MPLEVYNGYTFRGPHWSVLGVFWVPLSQMTFTPPHHYRYTQNMIFEAKLVFRRSFYVIQNDEMEVRDEGVVDQNYLLKTKTLCLPSTAFTVAFARQQIHRLQILALQCSTVQCNPVEGTVLESFFLPPPPPPPHSFPHPSPPPSFHRCLNPHFSFSAALPASGSHAPPPQGSAPRSVKV